MFVSMGDFDNRNRKFQAVLTVFGTMELDIKLRHVVLDHLHLVVAHHAVAQGMRVSRNKLDAEKKVW
jgi:hypothetical protein